MTTILAIRPEPGLSSTVKAGRALGLEISGHPLFEIVPVSWKCPDPAAFDGLLIGSANAILHSGDALSGLAGKPVFAVGQATASAAQVAGFSVAAVGIGGLQDVLDTVPGPARLLRIAGAKHVPLKPPPGITIETVMSYKNKCIPLTPRVISEIGEQSIILLHSALAAEHLAREWDRLGLKRGNVTLAALGPRIANALGPGWRKVHVSPHPTDGALLEMIRDMCV